MVSQTRSASSGSHRAVRSSSGTAGTHSAGNRRSASTGRRSAPHMRRNAPKGHRPKTPRTGGKRRHSPLKIILAVIGGLIGAALVAGIGAFVYLWATTEIPQPEKFALAQKTTVYYSDGTTEIGSFAEQNRDIIQCTDLPEYIGNAVVASENRTFYTDKGIDLKGIARALINNITTGSRQGGSTITQQYAERYYMGETTSYVGKAREAVLALKIAQSEDKSEVLCNYMNTIYLGRGAYGIQAAAKAYFNKDAKDLTMPEAALLAGIIPSPSTWDPANDPEQAEARFERVVKIMAEDGYISKQEAAEATMPQTVEHSQEDTLGGPNGYLLTMARDELVATKSFTKEDIDTGGYKIITTIDKDKQAIMQTVGDTRPADMPASIQVGGIATDPKTGEVVSVYAGSDYLKQQLNNATQSTFQPGSTMKPFALLGAAQEGVSFSTLFNGNSGQSFVGAPNLVNNALEMNWGNINLYQATANSVNTVFMNVNEHLTPQRTAEIAHEAGITSKIDKDSIFNVLGINSSTVWDLAQGHTTIAANGVKRTLHMVRQVVNDEGKELYKAPDTAKKVFDENDTALVQTAMRGTIQYGTATEAQAVGRPLAGKSGTANDETAASFVGYAPNLLNVWAIWNPAEDGSAQPVPQFAGYGVSSTGYPSHLFTEYMSQAMANMEVEQFPAATDKGTIGGPDGTWGLGGSRYSSYGSYGYSGTKGESANGANTQGNSSGNTDAGTSQNMPSNGQTGSGEGTDSGAVPGTGDGTGGTGSSGSTEGNGGAQQPGTGENDPSGGTESPTPPGAEGDQSDPNGAGPGL